MIKCFLGIFCFVFGFNSYADELNCVLPSLKDGKVVEKFKINLTAGLLAVKSQRYSHNEIEDRKVVFHSLNKPDGWESRTSLILLESKFKDTTFAPDILFVDWDKGSLKSAAPYQDGFTNGWECKKYEDSRINS